MEKKERKWIEIRKEKVKLPLFTDDIILYFNDPKDSNTKLLDLINTIWQSSRRQNHHIKINSFSIYEK
jgi:hypothetical protein